MRLPTKLILLLLTAVAAVMSVYALVTVSRTEDRMQQELMKMGDHLAMALSVGVLHHLEHGDAPGVMQVVRRMAGYEDVAGVVVLDARGDTVGTAGRAVTDGQPDGASGDAVHVHNRDIVDGAGARVGRLSLLLTGGSLRGHVEEARNHVLLAIVVLTGVISACIVFFSRRYLAGPLQQLTESAAAIGRGDLQRRIHVDGSDEIAELAAAFNRMAEGLQASTRRIVGEREYIRGVVDSLPEGVVVVDAEARVTAWNRTMASRYGRAADRVVGHPVAEALPGLAATPVAADLRRVLAGEAAKVQRVGLRLGDDNERVLTIDVAPLRRDDGDVEGAVIVLADVTERERLEEQVRRSDKLAAVGQLAAGLAHEIGTPLNVISGSAEYLRAEQPGAEELQTIVAEVHRISTLVQQLMRFARHGEPRVEAVQVEEVIDSVLSLMRRQMERKGVTVSHEVAPGLPPLAADRGQLQQVLVNLVMNAWQSMPEGGELRLAACWEGARDGACDGGHVVVEVGDTGTGIDPAHLARIFEPFYTTKEVGQGTGLGLPIVQRIVEDHDGDIDVRSGPGRGTTVRLRFPACADQEATADD